MLPLLLGNILYITFGKDPDIENSKIIAVGEYVKQTIIQVLGNRRVRSVSYWLCYIVTSVLFTSVSFCTINYMRKRLMLDSMQPMLFVMKNYCEYEYGEDV